MYLSFFLILLPKYFAKVHALSRASPPSGGAAGRPLCTAGSYPQRRARGDHPRPTAGHMAAQSPKVSTTLIRCMLTSPSPQRLWQ
jgi:hypothetical protein